MTMIINSVAYQKGARLGDITIDDISEVIQQPETFVWLALHEPDDALLLKIQQEFGLHELSIEDGVCTPTASARNASPRSLRRRLCGMCGPRRVEVALCSRRIPRMLRVASSALSRTQSCCHCNADGSCLGLPMRGKLKDNRQWCCVRTEAQ